MDAGARASLTTFLERGMGDVLLAWENEALYAANELAVGKVEVVWPSMSVLATPPVAVVDKVSQRNHTQEVARAYLAGLWEPQAQELAAQAYFRPHTQEVMARYRSRFPSITLFRVEDILGAWDDAQRKHFDDGGVFDQIAGKR
jgi:sulfate transport system substrate-binding protein